jgi:ABC-type antimicrobial peptide transport system permease subunit|tara:strand:- start:31279 stop:32394 length:1116 start_codon:yes stop_codon:yes gene_type:complete
MTRWMIKSLLLEPLMLMIAITSGASAFLLIIMFEGIFAGESEKIVAYVRNVEADVWVMQRGVSNMHMATSYVADWKVRQVRELPGVAAVDPILYLNTVVEAGEHRWFSYVVGLDVPSAYAGPWAMSIGRDQPALGEVIVPEVFARMAQLKIGSQLRITDHEFIIVGLSRETFSMANSVIFINKIDMEDIMSSFDISSFMLVKTANGVTPGDLAATIEREVDKVHALTAEQFLKNDKKMAMQMGTDTIALMTLIGGALAILLVAFTIYSQVARQRCELAVAKALGVTNGALYASVVFQAIVITLTSVIVATLVAALLMPVLSKLIPAVTMRLTMASVTKIAAAGIFVAIAASLMPARQIARLDPVSAFQGGG